MKFKAKFIAFSVSALLFSGMASAAITGTGSVEMTIKTTVTSGTCTAKLVNGGGAEASEIGFGDVFKSDLVNKTRVEPLKIVFSNCSGVSKATVAAAKGADGKCDGSYESGQAYFGGKATAFEVWSGAVDTGVQLKCKNPPSPQEVIIADGAGEFPMNSRIVLGKDRSMSDVATGAVTAPVTFTIAYP